MINMSQTWSIVTIGENFQPGGNWLSCAIAELYMRAQFVAETLP